MDDAEDADGSLGSQISRACDRCRARKIRCSRSRSCTNCEAAHAECVYTQSKQPQPRQRVLISSEYERKIDGIETRLSKIEDLVLKQNQLLEQLSLRISDHLSISRPQYNNPAASEHHSTTPLLAHSQNARRSLERLLQASPAIRADHDVVASLNELQRELLEQHRTKVERPVFRTHADNGSTELPMLDTILSNLQMAEKTDALFLFIWTPFFDSSTFRSMIVQLYHEPQSLSPARQTLTFGCLYYMLVERLSSCELSSQQELRSYAKHFMSAFEISLDKHNPSMITDLEDVLALVFGAAHAIQQHNFTLAYKLNTQASRVAQNLQWDKVSDASQSTRGILFHTIVYIDKCLSLRLGREPTIGDKLVTQTMPQFPDDPQFRPWHRWFQVLVHIGDIHGLIYRTLYSPNSFTIDDSERSRVTQQIINLLDSASSENSTIMASHGYRQGYLHYLVQSNEVLLGCLTTLTYLATPGSDDLIVNTACRNAARATIKRHLQIVRDGQHTNGTPSEYVNWALLNCPFTPFIVLFSHIIVEKNRNDLTLLRDFTASLDMLGAKKTESMINFHKLCLAFYDLAERYVSVSNRFTTEQESSMDVQTQLSVQDLLDMHSYHDDHNTKDMGPLSLDFTILPSSLFDYWLAGGQELDASHDWRDPV